MPDSYYDRLRKGTLRSLTIRPDAPNKFTQDYEQKHPAEKLYVDPNRVAREQAARAPEQVQTLTIHPDAQTQFAKDYNPYLSAQQQVEKGDALPEQRFVPEHWMDRRLYEGHLGFTEGMRNLAGSLIPNTPQSPRLAGGKTLTETAQNTIADPNELEKNLAANSGGLSKAVEFLGGVPPNAARYMAAEAATGGVGLPTGIPLAKWTPLIGATLGGAGADEALESSGGSLSPGDAARTGVNSAAWGAGFERSAEGGEAAVKPVTDALKDTASRIMNWGGVIPRALSWANIHPQVLEEPLHGLIETGVESGRDETTGEGVPSLFPSEQQIQSWQTKPGMRPYGAVPQITPQQQAGTYPLTQYMPSADNPAPLPAEKQTQDVEAADNEGTNRGCGRNSRVACYADGGLVDDDNYDDYVDDYSGDPGDSPGPIHQHNVHRLTLDPATIQHEIQYGPVQSGPIYINADAAKLGPYSPVGPPSLQAQPAPPGVPSALRSRLLGSAAPLPQFSAPQFPGPPQVDTSQQTSVFDQPWEGPSPTWKPMTPVGSTAYGLALAAMGDPEAGLSPRSVATQTGLGAMQALTPPRRDPVNEGIISFGPMHEGSPLTDPGTIHDMAVLHGAQMGSGAYSQAEIAAARARQTQDLIRNISPPPAAETGEVAEGAARDVKARTLADLDQRIPARERAVSSDPTRLINGQPFSSLDMSKPSEGFLPYLHFGPQEAEALNQRLFADAVRESEMTGGSAAIDAVRKTGMQPPTAEFLHRAMSQPQGSRYWYENSSDSFTGRHLDIPQHMVPSFIDNVAATSGGAKPYGNLKRSIGSYAENLQGIPIYTDLRDPASVRHALDPNLQRMQTPKYDNFSGTMQYTAGLNPRAPISVNDVQMADIFGIKGTDIGKNPVLYEVMSRYVNKLRDAQNALLPRGAQPWESWQIQAPSWTQRRIDKDPSSTYDDYAMVFPRIIQELNNAGIPTPNGKVTLDTLMDPRTPNVMSGTRESFMGTPTGTMEVATNKTPEGAAAAQFRQRLEGYDGSIPWVRDAKARYEQIQRNAMRDLAARHGDDPSFISQLMSEIAGEKLDVSRLEWNGYGTYSEDGGQQVINPNLRIPMGGTGSKGFVHLTQPQREAFLSILGQDLNQDSMAASHFTSVPPEQHATLPPKNRTFSVWMRRFDNNVNQPSVQQFSRQLGYPVNVARVPNGVLLDVNVADKANGPTYEAVHNAAKATFGQDPNVHDLGVIHRGYSSDFVHNSDYQEKINAHRTESANAGGAGPAGNPPDNISNIERIRQQNRRIAQEQGEAFNKWRAENEPKANQLEAGGGRRLPRKRPPPPSP